MKHTAMHTGKRMRMRGGGAGGRFDGDSNGDVAALARWRGRLLLQDGERA